MPETATKTTTTRLTSAFAALASATLLLTACGGATGLMQGEVTIRVSRCDCR